MTNEEVKRLNDNFLSMENEILTLEFILMDKGVATMDEISDMRERVEKANK